MEIIVDESDDGHGEIVIKGPNVAKGYLREVVGDRVEITSIDRVKTGDLGYVDEDKGIVLVGRKDHIINLMGEKIHPLEIELLAMKVEGVEDAFAQPKEHSDGRKSICLYVACASFDEKKKAGILALLRGNLARVFVPDEVIPVVEIERTELGSKVKRN